jgi:hypothetical protein
MNVRLIVPSQAADVKGTYHVDTITWYGRAIAGIAGGFTATQATGGWIDGKGDLVVEPVTVFDCDLQPVNGSHYVCIAAFYRLAERIAAELHQDCVYLSIDGKVEFVEP